MAQNINVGGSKPGPERNTGVIFLYVLLVAIVGTTIYNLYDNHRLIVVEQEIVIDRLPPSFDGFRILQISDLHGKYFGENQADLIEVINSLDYDLIAFTGDMNDSTVIADSVNNSRAFLDLLDGISNKEDMFYVVGNTGPYAVEDYGGAKTGELTAIGKVIQEKGCRMLTLPYALTRGNAKIWITPEMSEMTFFMDRSIHGAEEWHGGKEPYDRIQSFYQEAYASFREINRNPEVKIMLDHHPRQLNLTAEEFELMGNLDYDLILAGHYHGGQWRLPFIGALYIPSPTSGIDGSGFFPSQDEAKGLNYYGDIPQYVSAGLGASSSVRWTNFRLFNPPEINLITLKSK